MLRAVIYCRCSTEEESQQDALRQQTYEARQSVWKQGWILVDEYIEAKSGTTTANRVEYHRLYEELAGDKFDIVVIKSQDRLMRNTKDWYLFIDRLVSHEKKLFMYLDEKFYSADDALITGIKAILAEEYSKELSRKINHAHSHRQQDGRSFILPEKTYGLRKNADGVLEPVQEEVKAIRIMFWLCKSMGCISIGHYLEENGIYDREGRVFREETIRRIIRNPIRCGTVIQNRIHFDFQTKRILRLPKEQWVIHRHAVPAAVTEQEWKEANDAMDQRRERYCPEKCTPGNTRGRCGQYQLSGKIHCGECRSPYYRRCRKQSRDQKLTVEWKCRNYLQNGRKKGESQKGCDNLHLDEEKLIHLLEDASRQYFRGKEIDEEAVIDKLMSLLSEVLAQETSDSQLKKLQREKERYMGQESRLLDKLLDEVISDEDYREKRQELRQKLAKIDQQLGQSGRSEDASKSMEQRMDKIQKRLKKGAVREAYVSVWMEGIQDILVYSKKLDILYEGRMFEVPLDPEISYAAGKEAENQRIMDDMRENPGITARMIAEKEGISLAAANARIRRLKRQGKIRFTGRGGHGEWEVFVGNKAL